MKILHISDCWTGGVPSVIELLRANIKGSHVVLIGKKQSTAVSNYSNINLHRSFNPLTAFKVYWNITKSVNLYEFDIVHAHSSFGGIYASIVRLFTKKILVYSPHATPLMRPYGKLTFFISCLDLITLYCADAVIACSNDEKQVISKYINPEKVFLIYNGVQIGAVFTKNKKDIDVITVGRVVEQKRPDLFDVYVKKITYLHPDIRIFWVGGSSPFKADDIRFKKHVSEAEVEEYLARSKIFISFSDYEGLSLSALKASKLGCYLLLRNTLGNREPVIAGLTGAIFANVDDAVFRTTQVLAENNQYPRNFNKSSDSKNLNFDIAEQIKLTRRLYKRLLDKR